jgi:nicotinamide phosphoribosyltransferase
MHGEPFNEEGFMHIVRDHGGNLPVRIRAVPEGSVVPVHNVLFTVESTCPQCFWIVSYIETMLVRLWYPTTVATLSHRCKSIISDWLKKTADDESGLPFKLHDFGSRGVSSQESAAIGGAAHLLNFMGTDTVVGALMAEDATTARRRGSRPTPSRRRSTARSPHGDGTTRSTPTATC